MCKWIEDFVFFFKVMFYCLNYAGLDFIVVSLCAPSDWENGGVYETSATKSSKMKKAWVEILQLFSNTSEICAITLEKRRETYKVLEKFTKIRNLHQKATKVLDWVVGGKKTIWRTLVAIIALIRKRIFRFKNVSLSYLNKHLEEQSLVQILGATSLHLTLQYILNARFAFIFVAELAVRRKFDKNYKQSFEKTYLYIAIIRKTEFQNVCKLFRSCKDVSLGLKLDWHTLLPLFL